MVAAVSAAALACSALVAGCASAPVPSEQLAVADHAIEQAEKAGAAQSAPTELALAHEKVGRARTLAQSHSGKPGDAQRLAEQATVDAHLAEAKTQAAKADKSVAELEESLRALREEAERPTAMNPESSP
jgi:hypothetical protein